MIQASAVTGTGIPVLIIGLTYDDLARLVKEVVEFDTSDLPGLPTMSVWLMAAEDTDGLMALLPPG